MKKGWKIPKQRYRISNWREYNESLRQRGQIDIWITEDALNNWYEPERVYDGSGMPRKFYGFCDNHSKRLSTLKISPPPNKITDSVDPNLVAIGINSTGLKRFGRGEWHQEKYRLSAKRS